MAILETLDIIRLPASLIATIQTPLYIFYIFPQDDACCIHTVDLFLTHYLGCEIALLYCTDRLIFGFTKLAKNYDSNCCFAPKDTHHEYHLIHQLDGIKNISDPTWLVEIFEQVHLVYHSIKMSHLGDMVAAAQDKGPFWFSNILNEILQYIEIWNEFTVWNHCSNF